MIQTSLIFKVDTDTIKQQLEQLFCEAFGCLGHDLLDHAHHTTSVQGQTLTQTLTCDQNRYVLSSQREKDRITTIYTLTSINEDTCTVTLSESAESDIKSRQLNYLFFSLPLVNAFARKKLKRKLSILKGQIESRRPYADH